jgi:ankyrin repeat protein
METEVNTVDLLLAQTREEYTAFQLAAEKNDVETIKRMWVWAEETELSPNELKKKLLLARDKFGLNACQLAAEQGCLETLELFCSWTMELQLNRILTVASAN